MSQTLTITPDLSPGFDRARKLSRIMAVIFTIGFWLALLTIFLMLMVPFAPLMPDGTLNFNGFSIPLRGLSFAQRLWVLLAMELTALPLMILLHHARRLFGHFAHGEVFTITAIAHIRGAGLWLIVSFITTMAGAFLLVANGVLRTAAHVGSGSWPLVIGIVTFIAAYVMEEARRIAAYNAEIV